MGGRVSELSVLEEALEALDSRCSPGIIQVVGEPGIGKTRLLRELRVRAEARRYPVLKGRATEFELDLAFGVVVDALDDHLSRLSTDDLERLGPWLSELAAAFPAIARAAGKSDETLPVERYRTYRAVRVLLEELAAGAPLVVLLDDVHWADPASVELLTHLVAHPPSGPILLALAFRPSQTAADLSTAFAAAAREEPSRRLELSPLTRLEADALLSPEIDPSLADALYRESGGNPFYLEQLRRATGLAGIGPDVPAVELEGVGVPPLVRAALTSELASLDEPGRTLLKGAAVVGDPFEDVLAAEAASMEEFESLEIFDELARRELVRPTAVPGRLRFRHPILRRAVYESATISWRFQAHARVAATLSARGTPASALAHHVERSARPGDRAAVATLVEAARTIAPRAPATAAHWYDAALRLLPESIPQRGRRLELVVARATALAAAGRLEESQAALSEALERLTGATAQRVAVVTSCAAVEHALGRHQRGRARLLEALSDLADPHGWEALTLKLELASGASQRNDFTEMRAWAEETVEGVRRRGDPAMEALAAALLGWAHYALGSTEQAAAALDQAAAVFDTLDDTALAGRLDLALWLGWAEAWMERFGDAIRHCRRAIKVSRATGQGHFLVTTMNAEVWALLGKGQLAEATELAAAAAESSRLGTHGFLWEAVGFHALAASYAGDVDTALRLANESVAMASTLDRGLLTASAGLILAVVLAEAGHYERARNELLSAAGGPELPFLGLRGLRCLAQETLSRAALGLGEPEIADSWAAQAESVLGDHELPIEAGRARRTRASVLLAAGCPREAAELALQAAQGTAGVALLETGRSRLVAARALAQVGEQQRAVTELKRAEEELAASGANAYVAEARAELQRLGCGRSNRDDPVGALAALTGRERQIAELVSTGRTNREIAGQCYLSEKTVERHLSHVFAKLGVSSRAAVAGTVARCNGSDSVAMESSKADAYVGPENADAAHV